MIGAARQAPAAAGSLTTFVSTGAGRPEPGKAAGGGSGTE